MKWQFFVSNPEDHHEIAGDNRLCRVHGMASTGRYWKSLKLQLDHSRSNPNNPDKHKQPAPCPQHWPWHEAKPICFRSLTVRQNWTVPERICAQENGSQFSRWSMKALCAYSWSWYLICFGSWAMMGFEWCKSCCWIWIQPSHQHMPQGSRLWYIPLYSS